MPGILLSPEHSNGSQEVGSSKCPEEPDNMGDPFLQKQFEYFTCVAWDQTPSLPDELQVSSGEHSGHLYLRIACTEHRRRGMGVYPSIHTVGCQVPPPGLPLCLGGLTVLLRASLLFRRAS